MPTLDSWRAPSYNNDIQIRIELQQLGVGWFTFYRVTDGGTMEFLGRSPKKPKGTHSFTITAAQIALWAPPGNPRKRELQFDLRIAGAHATDAPVEFAALVGGAIIRAMDAATNEINRNADGDLTPLEIGKANSAQALVIPFNISF